MWDSLRIYAERTRGSVYSLVLVAPFLAVYEIGLLALRLSGDDFRARNGADAIIRFILFPLGIQRAGTAGAFAWSLLSALVLLACYIVWRAREGPTQPLERRYVGWLFAESAGWAALLFAGSAALFGGVLRSGEAAAAGGKGARPGLAAEIVLNSGAGVYEELLFRVLLVLLLVLFFTKVVHLDRVPGGIAAAVAAAVVFSLAHFGPGAGADSWGSDEFWPLFTFRWMAGVFFSLLFYFRSFGVAVAAHAVYDCVVTLFVGSQ
jgi:hypothetical protein